MCSSFDLPALWPSFLGLVIHEVKGVQRDQEFEYIFVVA